MIKIKPKIIMFLHVDQKHFQPLIWVRALMMSPNWNTSLASFLPQYIFRLPVFSDSYLITSIEVFLIFLMSLPIISRLKLRPLLKYKIRLLLKISNLGLLKVSTIIDSINSAFVGIGTSVKMMLGMKRYVKSFSNGGLNV